ncbi:MAG TPA: STAS domain-containing protein [Symbiobacteriaceae bacterium]|nr:STAS domain-containing protein [Symbiobacteriaceae bacterium]
MFQALELEGATILFLAGDLDAHTCVHVHDRVSGMIGEGRRTVVLDLSGVQRIYAAGMSVLLDLQRVAHTAGGRLLCCGARPFIREILRITSFDQTLHLHMDLDCALDALTAAS